MKPGWQVNAIPVRVSNIADEPTWGDLDVLALDEVRLAVHLMASTVVSDGKVKRGAETDAVRLALRRLKVSFYFIPDGDKFEQEKWLSRIRLRQATKFVELTGVSRTAQIFKTKERLALRPHGCNQKQCADWFKVIQQQQEKEGHGKDPDLDLSKHAIDAHLALYPRVSCVFELLLEFDEGGNKHVLSTVKGLQRLAGVTCTDSGGSDALMIFVTKLLLVSFARGTMLRSIKGKEFEATLHWALLVRRVAMYFRNKIREVNLPTCMEQLSEDPFAAHLTWPKGNLLRERITSDSTQVALADGDLLDEEAVSLWRALFDQRPDVMQIVNPEITKNPVIPAEAFLEKVSLDRDSFQLEKFRKAIRDHLAPPPVTQPPLPPPSEPPVTPQATEVDAVVAPEVSAPPPPNSTYFKRIVLGGTLEEMVNGMSTAEFQTVMGKIEDQEQRYVSYEVRPAPEDVARFISAHHRLQGLRTRGDTTEKPKLLFQIDGKNCVRHYGDREKINNPYKANLPRNVPDIEAAVSALHGPVDLSYEDRQRVSVVADFGCNWVTQIFDARRNPHITVNKTLLRKYVWSKGKGCGVMDLKLCHHNLEFVLLGKKAKRTGRGV